MTSCLIGLLGKLVSNMITLNCKNCEQSVSSVEFEIDDVIVCVNCWDC
jgi:hypothetical protein